MEQITLTSQLLHSASTKGFNGFTKSQLAVLGINWPAKRGWLKGLVGKSVPLAVYDEFKALGQAKADKPRNAIEEEGEFNEVVGIIAQVGDSVYPAKCISAARQIIRLVRKNAGNPTKSA